MSERILRALMQLFAIIARVDEVNDLEEVDFITSSRGRKVVQLFLGQELNSSLVEEYLKEFDKYLNTHHGLKRRKDGVKKRTSVNSVKILRICSEINQELTQRQKIVVLVRIIEFILTNESVEDQEIEFVNTVGESFNVSKEEYDALFSFVKADQEIILDSPNILYISSAVSDRWTKAKQIGLEGLDGLIGIMKVDSVNLFFLKYIGNDQIILNGQVVAKERQHIFNPGSSIRTAKTNPVYYSDVISRFLNDGSQEHLLFKCENLEFRFPNNKIGLHDVNFAENNGALIGIMGGSGAGKSTLLNVLNGNYMPSAGSVTINGIDIHRNPKEIEGVIGFISQDDLLIEELTVFQNLYFNAQLCFDTLSKRQIAKKVLALLKAIGLFESKDLKVGSPMEKTISGGQRKRLNIALELIREPSVLFVDEPTSGLSSRDSENIMDLLKELALKGKLIFVVIHQPSSDIFKMFDRMMILDQGGYPIFYGNSVDSVVHFKTEIDHANCEERECPTCGNVNPEQIFNIIEAKVVDEFGNLTAKRKISPEEWNKRFIKARPEDDTEKVIGKPHIFNKIPRRWKQFKVYFKRDILSKLTNKQYILLNAIEAPALALILGFFVKYFGSSSLDSNYTFESSENLPQFLFIAVVVALFLGLTVAAEEIIKDQKILKRESFLNLSRSSYIFSKISIMFIISAIQTIMFVLIGNFILEIRGMWFEYWFILFSTSCFANLLGLNISATFNSAKVIYILIPIMIIPQLLFSGVIVKFDKLHPLFSKEDSVPWIGNIMASRWAYEGLAVTQYKRNNYEAPFYAINQVNSEASWKRDYWLPELRNQQSVLNNNIHSEVDKEKIRRVENAKQILIHEIKQEERLYDPSLNFTCKGCVEALKSNEWSSEINNSMSDYFKILKNIYMKEVNESMALHAEKMKLIGSDQYQALKRDYFNSSLSDLATNRNDLDKIITYDSRLVQKADPIYKIPRGKSFFDTHFYAPGKNIFGIYISTFFANLLVIWGMTLLLGITLYYNFFRGFIELFGNLSQKLRRS
ncbi:MAG TPA: ATP-binding cassette domain-containing protein [Brumimicrobium sp.]|nr:ATP-binding cassette domain-containing protein [Brumimicrobium sp.]